MKLIPAGALAVLALTACDPQEAGIGDRSPPTTAMSIVDAGTDLEFLQTTATEQTDTLADISANQTAAADALEVFDLTSASRGAGRVADLFAAIRTEAERFPGANTETGRAVLAMYETCEDAWEFASVALGSATEASLTAATTRIEECSAAMNTITSEIPS